MTDCARVKAETLYKLRICARYLGWLRSTPEFDNSSRSDKIPNRWTTLYGNKPFTLQNVGLPLTSGKYLLTALLELTPGVNNGFGVQPQTWTEIASYGSIVGYLNNNELRILYELSNEWVAGFRQGKVPLSKSPLELLET